jgi:hypothetical protein
MSIIQVKRSFASKKVLILFHPFYFLQGQLDLIIIIGFEIGRNFVTDL